VKDKGATILAPSLAASSNLKVKYRSLFNFSQIDNFKNNKYNENNKGNFLFDIK